MGACLAPEQLRSPHVSPAAKERPGSHFQAASLAARPIPRRASAVGSSSPLPEEMPLGPALPSSSEAWQEEPGFWLLVLLRNGRPLDRHPVPKGL